MVHLSKFVHTTTGRYIMSIILGFGLASLFRVVCKDNNCIIFKGSPLEEKDIYKYNNKCYTFNSESTTCDKDKRKIDFA
jgi:hypothetical protein